MNLNIQKEPFSGKDQAVKNSIPESDVLEIQPGAPQNCGL